MAETSGNIIEVARIRVYGSGPGFKQEDAHDLAGHLEARWGQKGSSVTPQEGRWDREVEAGYVVELAWDVQGRGIGAAPDATPQDYVRYVLEQTHSFLQWWREANTLVGEAPTFYVTGEAVYAMEVF